MARDGLDDLLEEHAEAKEALKAAELELQMEMIEVALRGKNINEIANSIKIGHISATALTEYYLRRIEKYDSGIGAVVRTDREGALREAARIDQIVKAGAGDTLPPLAGISFLVKDTFETEGILTECGGFTKGHIPKEDAAIVAQLKAQGAIMLGKTRTPEGASDLQTQDHNGKTSNPYDLEKTAGGSSGGSAAAVAADLAVFAVGSDLGGSVRIPAAFCGVTGYTPSNKPGEEVLPRKGHIPPIPGFEDTFDLGTPGLLTKTPEDSLMILDALEIQMEQQETAKKILHIRTSGDYVPGPEIEAAINKAVELLKSDDTFDIDSQSEGGVREELKRMDLLSIFGFTFGMQIAKSLKSAKFPLPPSFVTIPVTKFQYWRKRRAARVSPEHAGKAYQYLMKGLEVSKKEEKSFVSARTAVREKLADIFEKYDAIILPTTTVKAFSHRAMLTPIGKLPYLAATTENTILANLTGAASVSVPIGMSEDGLPLAVQIIAKDDRMALQIAAEIQSRVGMIEKPDLQAA